MKQFFPLALLVLLAGCTAYPPPPPIGSPSTGAYRALGTEPFWSLTITPVEMTFDDANGPVRIVEPTPRPIIGIAGEIYQTPRLNVNIVHARCSDGMSDRVYPDKVQVSADGRRFEGCGGEAVVPAALAGTNWRVSAINGRATPPAGQFFMNFEAARIGARFGCNGLGADYSQAGNKITTGPVIGTQMACPDMNFETQGGAILALPMRMTWAGGDRLTLSNTAGSIELTRSY
jgi:heat shock protein HslJ